MLPFDQRQLKYSRLRQNSAPNSLPDYARRLCDVRQMDFEAAFDQMLTLCSRDAERAYASFNYRKQTKNQWARDDPAFMVVLVAFLAVACIAYGLAFGIKSVFAYIWLVLFTITVDWLLPGIVIASVVCWIANRYLRSGYSHSLTVEQEVEWLFALDVHCNGFFVSFLVTYVLQYMLLPVLMQPSVLSCLLSNLLYAGATIWYAYISHLGYRALPFLSNTQVFLWYPIIAVVLWLLLSVVLLILGMKINPTRMLMAFHYG